MPTLASIRDLVAATVVLARAQMRREGRVMLAEMRRIQTQLPARYEALALPDFLTWLTPERADWAGRDEHDVRELADALALLDRRSPFGLCLRRALLRYHFLRRAGVPLGIPYQFRQAGGGGTDAGAIHKQREGIPSISV
ncbi:MAG TPA: hypothetical protein EYP25_11520, partial [Anaerolineae bacterium]|nr:hypothetical protein [Anaerolineae bacterium]